MSIINGTCNCKKKIRHDFSNGDYICECGFKMTRTFNVKDDEYEIKFFRYDKNTGLSQEQV